MAHHHRAFQHIYQSAVVAVMMKVTDHRKWLRAKYQMATLLLITGICCAGGLESTDGTEPMPSFAGFVISMSLLAALIYNIIRTEGI